ncbi:MAG: SIS domain-containing protein [Elusimicrobia bacterium]|nr:SIS domain-containing protein [Elusimicrobiota bacterium]
MEKTRKIISENFRQSFEIKDKLYSILGEVASAARLLKECVGKNKKIIVFGNGGSAADAQHFVAELACKFEKVRKPLRAVALTTNTSMLTATSNDFGFEFVFSRQIEALACEGDVAVAISTSGNSENVLKAVAAAKKLGVRTVALTGGGGGKLKKICDIVIDVPSSRTSRIQEAHILILHSICEVIESDL